MKQIIGWLAATVAGGLILSETESLIILIKKIPIFFKSVFELCWSALSSDYSLAGWLVLGLGIFALFGFLTVIFLLYALLRPDTESEYLNYTEDIIDGVLWRWSWNKNSIVNLVCYCQNCDAQLIFQDNYSYTNLICERCDFPRTSSQFTASVQGDQFYVLNATKREILRRVRKKQYPSN